MERITIQVSDSVIHSAERMAAQTQQSIEGVLSDWLDYAVDELPVDMLPDEAVLAFTELQLTSEQQETLNTLLIKNREGILDVEGRQRLDEMMRIYERGLLCKAQALRVAVQRGLCEPLHP